MCGSMFVDFYETFNNDATWSAKEVMKFNRNIKNTKNVMSSADL